MPYGDFRCRCCEANYDYRANRRLYELTQKFCHYKPPAEEPLTRTFVFKNINDLQLFENLYKLILENNYDRQ